MHDPNISRELLATSSYNKGLEAELKVIDILQKEGLQILYHRYKTKYGEIDIISQDQKSQTLLFVEVKYRKKIYDSYFALPQKQIARLNNAAEIFISDHREYVDFNQRFDCFLVSALDLIRIQNFTI